MTSGAPGAPPSGPQAQATGTPTAAERDAQIAPGQTASLGGISIENQSDLPIVAVLNGNVLILTAPPGFVPVVEGASCEPVDGDPSSVRCVVTPGARIVVRTTVAGVARQATRAPTPLAPVVSGSVAGLTSTNVTALPHAGAPPNMRGVNRAVLLLLVPALLAGAGLTVLRRSRE